MTEKTEFTKGKNKNYIWMYNTCKRSKVWEGPCFSLFLISPQDSLSTNYGKELLWVEAIQYGVAELTGLEFPQNKGNCILIM